jgi:hypothetical protein
MNALRALEKAGLPRFRVYDLRHTFASLLLAQGAPITYVAALLSHSRPTTTLQWYAHWLPGRSRPASICRTPAYSMSLSVIYPRVACGDPRTGLVRLRRPE